ncbi:MAG: reverse transcriptase domain-containing protein [Patescibacteria group bacterium]
MLADQVLDKAFKILRRNYGCPGLDGLSIKEIKRDFDFHKAVVLEKYNTASINILPIKKVRILDYSDKLRSVFVYCLYERWLQMCLKLQLAQKVNNCLASYVFGYRPGFDMEMLKKYIKMFGKKYVLHLDLEKYFDSINREVLLKQMETQLNVEDFILTRVNQSLSHINYGLPRGNALSPVLSNMYLSRFDMQFKDSYARFSDDLFFTFDKVNERDVIINEITPELRNLGLSINFQKTEVQHADKF